MPDAAAALRTAWEAETRARKERAASPPREYLYASGRKPCVRWMALDLLHPEDSADSFNDPHTMERFLRGDEREAAINARLFAVGMRSSPPFRPIEQQSTVEVRDRDGVLLLRGKKEGSLLFEDGRKVTYEVKSGRSVERAETLEDLDRSPWARAYVDQLLVYLLAEGRQEGVFILDRPGLPAFVPARLEEHLARAESFLQDARMAINCATAVNRRLQARFDEMDAFALAPMTTDRSICRRCPHLGKSCFPEIDYGPGLVSLDDEELAHQLGVELALEDAASEHAAAKKYVRERLRGVEQALVAGQYLVKGRWQKDTKRIGEDTRPKQEIAKGKFLLDIQKLESEAKD